MKWIMKKLRTPSSTETKLVDAVTVWMVRWESRYGIYSHETNQEAEAFLSEEEANQFAESLRAAFKLVRHVGANKVSVTKRESDR